MAMRRIPCPVLGASIVQVTDLEGIVTRIICAEYDDGDGTCRLKKSIRRGGPLSQLLQRVNEDVLDTQSRRCIFRMT